MKNTRILFIWPILLHCIYAEAITISQEDAVQKALTFFQCSDKHVSIDLFTVLGGAEMYKVITEKGWALLSTEKSITPILAYSTIDPFPEIENMPDGMKWLFSYYEDAIAYAKQYPQEYGSTNAWEIYCNESFNTRDSVCLTSLGEVKWGQCVNNSSSCIKSYNKFCPTFHNVCCDKTYVGCGAVAIGQVLWYYQWPHTSFIPDQMLNDNGQISGASSYKFYDWSLMPAAIYANTPIYQADEVAALLRDCGYAAHMKYGENESISYIDTIGIALTNNFGYATVTTLRRSDYPGPAWVNLMKSEISNGRPVIYRGEHPRGRNVGKGHFFILYGFKDDYFRINWGKNGNWNSTYFRLDSLYVNGIHYNDGQYALINIQPSYPLCTPITIRPYSNAWNTHFLVQRGGGITVGNRKVFGNMQGGILSGDYVRLTTGFRIYQGASVIIGIRNMHCDDREELLEQTVHQTPGGTIMFSKDNNSNDTTQVTKMILDGQFIIRRGDELFNAQGARVR